MITARGMSILSTVFNVARCFNIFLKKKLYKTFLKKKSSVNRNVNGKLKQKRRFDWSMLQKQILLCDIIKENTITE